MASALIFEIELVQKELLLRILKIRIIWGTESSAMRDN